MPRYKRQYLLEERPQAHPHHRAPKPLLDVCVVSCSRGVEPIKTSSSIHAPYRHRHIGIAMTRASDGDSTRPPKNGTLYRQFTCETCKTHFGKCVRSLEIEVGFLGT